MSAPLRSGDLSACLARLDAGVPFTQAFEAALREVPPDVANRWMLLHREGRGAWHPLLHVRGGKALFVGNALSGGWVPLAANGFDVVLVDSDHERLRFAAHRAREHAPDRVRIIRDSGTARLPFESESFDLVVLEEAEHLAERLGEARRVCGGEIFVTAENRLAYKRSTGKRGQFRVTRPWTWVARALRSKNGTRSLAGYKRLLRDAAFEEPSAHALYPHMRDFTHVVGLDAKTPRLPIGPMEKKNRVKLLGQALGLFPLLTPSFALSSVRRSAALPGSRILRILSALSERLGEERPTVEHWTATRGNSIVMLTRGSGDSSDPSGRWSFHFGLSKKENYELARHAKHLAFVKDRFPDHPSPELLFAGELEGLSFVCERRIEGLGAPQLSGRRDCAARLFADVARDYSKLVTEAPRALHEDDLATLIDSKFELVARFATRPETLENLERTRLEVRERLSGQIIPRVFYHADLRSKHIRVHPDGRVVGYLDFGAAEVADLPYFDLMHLIVHERIHEHDLHAGRAWSLIREEGALRDYERSALDQYSEALGLTREYRDAIELAYPVLVAAMAEKNWDYSRPEWLHRHFGF